MLVVDCPDHKTDTELVWIYLFPTMSLIDYKVGKSVAKIKNGISIYRNFTIKLFHATSDRPMDR